MSSAISQLPPKKTAAMSAADQARLLVGDADGWPLAPVVSWLFEKGCRFQDPGILLQGLADHLLEVGAPLWRLRLGFWIIHPQIAAMSFEWLRDTGQTVTDRVAHGIYETPAYVGSPAEEVRIKKRPVRYRLNELDPKKDHSVLFEIRDKGGVDYLALPMEDFSGDVYSLFITTDEATGFTDADIAKFEILSRYLMPIIEAHSQHRRSVTLMDTYVGERTAQRVLGGQIKRGDGELIDAALWFSDLRDFTPLTETLAPEDLLSMLNAYFEFVFNAVNAHQGEVLRFIGDAMLIVFPAERCKGRLAEASRNALSAAEDAFNSLAVLNNRRRRDGQPEIRFGVGLHVGTVIYGNVGAPNRLDFTVMGPAVNRTARLESLTKEVKVPMLMSRDFVDLTKVDAVSKGVYPMKGVAEPQEVFACPRLK